MTTKEMIRQEIARNNEKLDNIQRQAVRCLEHIEQTARKALERGDTYIESTLDYDVRQLGECNAQRVRLLETNRMLDCCLRADSE